MIWQQPTLSMLVVFSFSHSKVAVAAGEWADKLRRYTSLTEHLVKSNPKRASDPDVIKLGEAERVLKLLTAQVLHTSPGRPPSMELDFHPEMML